MTYFITVQELKQTTFNSNLDDEYIIPALEEAQSIFLREIIGDLLYTSITNKIDDETLSGKYLTLVDQYIKPYLTYKVQSVIVIPLNNKTRNAGIINQYDQGFNTSTMKDTAYLADHYNSRAEFYANRLTTYLQKNTADFPEYGYSDDNITQPTDTQNVTTIYLGGSRKRGCGCNTSTGSASANTVDWDNIQNRPDFAEVATSGSYNDLEDTPEIPTVNDATINIYQGSTLKGSFSLNQENGQNINLEAGGSGSTDWSDIQNKPNFATVATSGDYNDLQNKPTIPTVPTNVSAFNNDAGYTTFDGDYNSLTNKPSIPAAPVQSDWNENDNTSLAYIQNKPTIPAAQVQADWQQNDSTQPDYIKNRPSMPSAQIQSDWNQTNTSEVDYIKNKPSLATVATSGSYPDLHNRPSLKAVATSGDYNDLTNKPTIPAAQVQSDWNANSGMGEILNKPSLATVATSGDYNDLQNKPSIPAAQVQSDWNAVSGMGEILNKPTIPTVNDSTINIYQGSTLKGSFSLNQSSGQNINLDAGGSGSQVQSDWSQVDNSQVDFIKNKPTVYNHWFGTQAQYDLLPTKDINTIYHIEGAAPMQSDWNEADPTSMAYINNKPSIPAAQVKSDWNAVSGMGEILNKPSLATVATSGDYNDLQNKPSIPVVPSYTTETWTFTLSDQSTVTKTVYLVPSV